MTSSVSSCMYDELTMYMLSLSLVLWRREEERGGEVVEIEWCLLGREGDNWQAQLVEVPCV